MYDCRVQFYLVGLNAKAVQIIKEAPPLEHFSHLFVESAEPDWVLAFQADVILANLEDAAAEETVKTLLSGKRAQTDLIVLASKEQTALLTPCLSELTDVWTLPLSEEELRFRFMRWQQSYKRDKDAWQTRQFLETTINSIPNLIWYKTKDGIHEKVNASFCETVGKTREQVEGRSHAYIWDVEQDDPACVESERVVMETEQTCVSEEMIQTGEGTRLLTTYKSPLYNLDGSVMGTVGVAIDVTNERAYAKAIIDKNIALETLFTTMDCGVLTHTLDGSQILNVNQAALNILGYESQEDMEREGFKMVAASVVDEDKPKLRECIQSLTKAGDSVSIEYRVRHRDGELLHVMGNVKLVEENGVLCYQRFLLDCTTQKQWEMEERLTRQRRQMELIHALSIDYSLVCVFDLGTGAGSTLQIDACEFGVLDSIFCGDLQLEDCLERYIQSCVYAEDQEMMRSLCTREGMRQKLEESTAYYINYRTLCGGEMRYFQMKVVRAGSWEDQQTMILGFRNVDDETQREMEKKTLLENALAQANRASKAKGTFLSNMSHDIRTPMNAIVGFTTLAITHIDHQEQVEEYLKKILTSSNHLVSLINDVLDMSRIESGKMSLDETLCSLPDILHGLRSIVQTDIRSKQLELYIDTVDVMDEDIYCDKLRLNQVLLNLLNNSIKYTNPGGIVSVRIAEKSGAPTGYAAYEFRIKDTGIGMSEEFVAHIFEPFERERNSTISGIQGTGLGMAITKNIVDMMNGDIQVKSEQGVGTEFIVSLTFRLGSAPKEPVLIPALKNCRALVVDDDFNTCDSVTYMLQQMGLRAEWTLSGKEAVMRTRQAVMRQDQYTVYVIDWLMPDMNGVEVVRRIRAETGEDVPIILLSAYDWFDIEDEAREAGVTAFCSKPLFMSELRRCLNSVVSADQQADAGAEQRPKERHTGRILLAEDNELNQEIAQAILEEAGFSLEIAANGAIAVDMLRQSGPGYYDLVLMDIQMPVMDGYAATKAVRALEDQGLASIPILAMTANAFEEDKRLALECGMNGHIAKPIDVKELFDVMDHMLT